MMVHVEYGMLGVLNLLREYISLGLLVLMVIALRSKLIDYCFDLLKAVGLTMETYCRKEQCPFF